MARWRRINPRQGLYDTGGHITGADRECARVVDRSRAIKVAHELDGAAINQQSGVGEDTVSSRGTGNGTFDCQGGSAGNGHRVAGVIDEYWRIIAAHNNKGCGAGSVANGQRRALRATARTVVDDCDSAETATRAAENGVGAVDLYNPTAGVVQRCRITAPTAHRSVRAHQQIASVVQRKDSECRTTQHLQGARIVPGKAGAGVVDANGGEPGTVLQRHQTRVIESESIRVPVRYAFITKRHVIHDRGPRVEERVGRTG